MGLVIPVGYGLAKMRWKLVTSPDEVVCTFGVAPGTPLNPTATATAIDTAATAGSGPGNQGQVGTGWQWRGIDYTEMTATGPILGSVNHSTTGTGAGATMPPNVAVLIQKKSNHGGRAGRGRFFVPAQNLAESSIDNAGVIDTSALTTIQNSWTAFFAALSTATIGMVILHVDNSTPTPVTQLVAQNIVATQRRRLRR